MKSKATKRFWQGYRQLPPPIQQLAVRSYRRWRLDPSHPSLHFKQLHGYSDRFSVRIGRHHRAIGMLSGDTVIWVWIGSHEDYNGLLGR